MAQHNPLSISSTQLTRLFNSAGFGAVLSRDKVRRHCDSAGFRISATDKPSNINLINYISWLHDERHREIATTNAIKQTYEERKEAERQRQADMSVSGRDIGNLPSVVDPERKARAETDFKFFCEAYFPEDFYMGWSEDHLRVIQKIETAVLKGGLFALAMPRGSGKSTLAELSAVWSMLYGHREFILFIGATQEAALEILDSIKTSVETNENLEADFPEVCFPIQSLEGIANRCAGQLYKGERTRISWTSNEIILPTIQDSKASGIIVRAAGITGRIRGMRYKRADGRSVRPSLVVVDDPQTRESAESLTGNEKRKRILSGDILGLAGPGQKISGIMPCTIIAPGDMADQILDKAEHPEWNGSKTQMVAVMPTNMELWEKYAEIRAECLRTNGHFQEATDFYVANREAMDFGAKVSWEDRFDPDEVSALQHAMNLKFTDEVAFWAEYQNEPLPTENIDDTLLSVDEIASKLNGLRKDIIPLECDKLTMFVDVQKALLFYVVVAWSDNFTGAVIDYGAWPEQPGRQFTLEKANPTIQTEFPNLGFEGGLYKALEELANDYFNREFEREDGAMLKIERAMIDANWGQSTDIIYQFCRQSQYSNILFPSHGRYVGASSKPMTEYKKQVGDRLGFNWMIPSIKGKRAIRHVIYDTNFWKSFVHARLGVAMGDKSCLSLYGRSPAQHQLLAEHLTAEYRIKTEGRGRVVDEWKIKPSHDDNHWLDCLVGCAVCASMLGATLPEFGKAIIPKNIKPTKGIKLSDLQKMKRNT